MNKRLCEAFLPTVVEIEGMNNVQLQDWILSARQEIKKRQEIRDPLVQLKKRICKVIGNKEYSEAQREALVLAEIENYFVN